MSAKDFSKSTIEEIRSFYLFHYFAIHSYYKRLKNLSAKNESGTSSVASPGGNLYHVAAEFADAKAIQFLMEKGVKPVVDKNKDTPLHIIAGTVEGSPAEAASFYEKHGGDIYRSTEFLLEAGVDPLRKNLSGETAFYRAAVKGIYPAIQALVDKKVSIDAGEAESVVREICSRYPDREAPLNKELFEDRFYLVHKGEIERANKVIAILQEAKIGGPELEA
jgi:ankyrin repeat protein